jgi:hypothetical protein
MPPNEQPQEQSIPESGKPREPDQREPRDPQEARARAQMELLLRAYGDQVGRGPSNWPEVGIQYLYRQGHILVRDEYLDQVRRIVDGTRIINPVVRGVTLLSVPMPTMQALDRIRGAEFRSIEPDPQRVGLEQFGPGVAAPDYLITISDGTAGTCPASEPIPVDPAEPPYPGLTIEKAAGEGIRVVVVDTGLDPDAVAAHPWLTGVTGDPDLAVPAGGGPTRPLGPYAGHGTFIAGVVRCMAPAAEVIVRRHFSKLGALFESDLVRALDLVLENDYPDIISMSAGTWTFDPSGLLGLSVFNETRLRQHKGVVLVAAAGNDNSRRPFWPAAAPWTISVGALATDWRSRAHFSNYGRWVDVYAPGEDLVNAFPVGRYTYREPALERHNRPHRVGDTADFEGMARWSGTSFATPMVAGMIAARMSHTGENGRDAGAATLAIARSTALFGLGAALLPR